MLDRRRFECFQLLLYLQLLKHDRALINPDETGVLREVLNLNVRLISNDYQWGL